MIVIGYIKSDTATIDKLAISNCSITIVINEMIKNDNLSFLFKMNILFLKDINTNEKTERINI